MQPSTQTPLPVDGTVFFISDLHLSPELPKTTATFLAFLRDSAPQAQALFILGDFFEVWIGDDCLKSRAVQGVFASEILNALAHLSAQGTQLFWMAGNRDFLLRSQAAQQAKLQRLTDPTVIRIGTQNIVLTHGDVLCTDDHAYQTMRSWFRRAWVQRLFLWLPLSWRQRIAAKLRRQSQQSQSNMNATPAAWSDVNTEAVAQLFQQTNCHAMIHGHTHRPAVHQHADGVRYVLSDWDVDHVQPRANYLRWEQGNTTPTSHDLTIDVTPITT